MCRTATRKIEKATVAAGLWATSRDLSIRRSVIRPEAEGSWERTRNDAIHDVAEGGQDNRGGDPANTRRPRDDGPIQRNFSEGRSVARRRWPSTELEGREGHVPERQGKGDRRPIPRNEGADRRLLDDQGQLEGRGYRMGEAG